MFALILPCSGTASVEHVETADLENKELVCTFPTPIYVATRTIHTAKPYGCIWLHLNTPFLTVAAFVFHTTQARSEVSIKRIKDDDHSRTGFPQTSV